MNESKFNYKLKTDLNKHPKTHFFKTHGGTYSSVIQPDLIGWIDGLPFAIESKIIDIPKRTTTLIDFTKQLTKAQISEMKKMHNSGVNVWVAVLCRPENFIYYVPWPGWEIGEQMHCGDFREINWSEHSKPNPIFPSRYNADRTKVF